MYLWKGLEYMKSLNAIREIDKIGRVVLPKKIRDSLGIVEGSILEIYVANDMIILKKQLPRCIICGNKESLKNILDKNVCDSCLKEAKEFVI